MVNFPFFRFPYPNYYYHYYPSYNKTNFLSNPKKNIDKQNINEKKEEKNNEHKINRHQNSKFCDDNCIENFTKTSSKYNNFGPIRFANPFSQANFEEPLLEVLGIHLYLDDIIILGLLFFLYEEDVQDEMLFLSLILLLLT